LEKVSLSRNTLPEGGKERVLRRRKKRAKRETDPPREKKKILIGCSEGERMDLMKERDDYL